MRRRLKILLIVLLAPIVLVCVFLLFERVRGQISLARYKRELAVKGEKLTFQELIPQLPEGENGAPAILADAEKLTKGSVLPDNYPPAMRLAPSGHAVVGFREDIWVEDGALRDGHWVSEKVTNRWDQLAVELKTNEVLLARIRSALTNRVLNNQIDYFGGPSMSLPHLPVAKALSFWFGAGAQCRLHEGNHQAAADDLVAQAQLPRLLAEDGIVISELVRIAVAAIALRTTWEAMQDDSWTDNQLARLQAAWESNRFANVVATTLIGERAFGEAAFARLRASNEAAVETLFWQAAIPILSEGETPERPWWRKIVSKEMYCRIWRFAWAQQDERHYLEGMQTLIEIARTSAQTQSFREVSGNLESFKESCARRGFYDQLRYPTSSQSLGGLSGVIKRALQGETERELALSAIALKRYALRHGELPNLPDALVPEFLPSVPVDYMDGKPLKYHLNSDGGFTLYSVGEDGKDDGGDASLLPGKSASNNLWNRKDFVWPAPATLDETEAWRQEQLKH